MKQFTSIFVIFFLVAGLSTPAAQAASEENARQRVEKAADVLNELMGIKENGIPNYLLDRCEAIIVFPSVYKGGLGFGGRYGKGVVSSRLADGSWSAPVFLKITGGSFGLQIGVQSTDFVLLVMNKKGLKGLLKSKFTLGADASVAAGPVGRGAEASTDAALQAEIYSYSRCRGIFAGLSLEGSVITVHGDANSAFYKKPVKASDVLLEGKVKPPEAAEPLLSVLRQCCPVKK
jgi:lipid-binding SYLF domain-containing protein